MACEQIVKWIAGTPPAPFRFASRQAQSLASRSAWSSRLVRGPANNAGMRAPLHQPIRNGRAVNPVEKVTDDNQGHAGVRSAITHRSYYSFDLLTGRDRGLEGRHGLTMNVAIRCSVSRQNFVGTRRSLSTRETGALYLR